MVRSLVLAAGASSRMGTPKASLALSGHGETFLSRIVRTLFAAGLPDVVIVAGAHVDAVRGAWAYRDRRVRILTNSRWESGQLSSLLVGLDAPSASPLEAVVVTLVDVPLVLPETVKKLVRAWRESRAPIVRPARGEKHGHPVIFDRVLFDELRRADPVRGAKSIVRAHAADVLNVPIDDPGAYRDVDTPEDYSRIALDDRA
jgi:CTP:molybdopterin cytidylyltransferase MocA